MTHNCSLRLFSFSCRVLLSELLEWEVIQVIWPRSRVLQKGCKSIVKLFPRLLMGRFVATCILPFTAVASQISRRCTPAITCPRISQGNYLFLGSARHELQRGRPLADLLPDRQPSRVLVVLFMLIIHVLAFSCVMFWICGEVVSLPRSSVASNQWIFGFVRVICGEGHLASN